MSKFSRTKQSGFSTIELLLAVALLAIAFGSVILVVFGNQKVSVDTQTNNEAIHGVEKLLEEARILAKQNFATPLVYSASLPARAEDGTTINNFYTVTRSETYISDCVKKITAKYSWNDENRPQVVELSTEVSDPTIPFLTGTDCSPIGSPPGGGGVPAWHDCASATHADISPSGNEGRDIELFRVGSTRYAAIASYHSSAADHDLWIYNVSYVNSMSFVASLDTGAKGLIALQVAQLGGNGPIYAFGLTDENNNQLRIYDLSTTVTAPAVVGAGPFSIPGGAVKTLYYFDKKLYVASGTQLVVIDVSTPSLPVLSAPISIGSEINQIAVRNGYAFLATSDNNGELKAVNLSNTSQIYSFDASGNNDGTSVFIAGGVAFLGRDSSGAVPDFYTVNISNPATMTAFDSADLGHNNGAVVDIRVNGGFAFIASTDPNDEFDVWNVTDVTNIFKQCVNDEDTDNDDGVNLPNVASGLDFIDNIAFGVIRSNDALRIIKDPNAP